MTKDEILDYFKDIDAMYNDCTRYDTLKRMLDELQEPCTDAISREDALMALTGEWKESRDEILSLAIRRIRVLPPVTPAEKVGRWVKTPKAVMGEGYMWYCDKCEHQVYQDSSRDYPSEKYCPNCGAKMQEVEE